MKVCFDTYGCRLNRAEALQAEADYRAAGWEIVERHDAADLIVLRGCSVTSFAQKDCEKAIRHIREKYPAKQLLVTGCLPLRVRQSATHLSHGTSEVPAGVGLPGRTARAYLKVQDGCSSHCTFCIVPQFRGAAVSTPLDVVLDKARRFVDFGYHEIVVTGCNLSQWSDGTRRLPDLVAALADIDSGCRIRLGSVEPTPVAGEVVEAMAERENVCRYLHLPVQSGSEAILLAMRRPYTVSAVDALVVKARRLMPNLAVCCDLIAGFPGEAMVDFKATRDLVGRCRFAKAHVFPFSSRPGTHAERLPDEVSRPERVARTRKLKAQADELRTAYAKTFVGKTVEIVIEDEANACGWTSEYLWCTVTGRDGFRAVRRERIRAQVSEAKGHVLAARVLS